MWWDGLSCLPRHAFCMMQLDLYQRGLIMRSLLPVEPVGIGMGLILLLGGMGCATTSDLEKLNQGLTQKLESLDTSVQTQMADLRTELMEDIKSEAASTRRAQTEQAEERARALARIEALTDKLNKQLESVQQAVAPVAELPSYLSGLSAKMQSIGQALLGNYELEEAALRERLKILEQARKRLEPVVAEQGIEAKPAQ